MGYKDENIKHRQGITETPKYKCPHCGHALSIPKKVFMIICGKCNAKILGEEL